MASSTVRGANHVKPSALIACAVFAFLMLLSLGFAANGEPGYSVAVWRTTDGLPSNRIRALLQDKVGFLWVATFNGVARFDGIRFRQLNVANSPALPNNLINSLFQDSAGRIWLGHDTGEITVWEDGKIRSISTEPWWLGHPVDRFAEDRLGTIWVGNRLGWLLPVRGLRAGLPLKLVHGQRVGDMTGDRDGNVWLANEGGVFLLDGAATERPAKPVIALSGNTSPMILSAHAGGVWVVGSTYAQRWVEGKWTEERISTSLNAPPAYNRAIETRSGNLAIGTFTDGLHVLPYHASSVHLSTADGLPARYVTAITEDREGNLWIGSGDEGLCRISRSLVATLVPPSGWQGRAVQAMVETNDGSLWAGTEGAGIFRLHDGQWTQLASAAGLPNQVVKCLFEDHRGGLWTGLSDGSLGQIVGDRYEPVSKDTTLGDISAIFQASDGRMWYGGLEGAKILAPDTLKLVSSENEPLTHVRSFAETADGAVWIATLGRGLGRYYNGKLKIFHRTDGLPSDFLWSLHATNDGALWIGTYDRGLARYRDGHFSLIGTEQGLPGNMVGQILPGDDGTLWVATNGGIARMALKDLNACADAQIPRVSLTTFDSSNGLTTPALSGGVQYAATRSRDGTLFFATDKGIARIEPRSALPARPPPPVLIEGIRIDGVETAMTAATARQEFSIEPGSRRVEVDYTGLNLSAAQRIRFRYRLEGADADWVEVESRRTAFFSYLRPGAYVFHVQAALDNNSSHSPDVSLRLRVVPFFWETTWFALSFSATALLVVAAVVALFQRARHRRRMEKIERARAIDRDRTRIAHDLHDKIGSGLTELSFLSHSALAAANDPDKITAKVRDIQGTTAEMTEAIDEIVWAVNPRHDSLESLLSYLSRTLQEFARRTRLQCHIEIPIDHEQVGVSPEVRHELYLALREALNNVIKHSGATEVRLSFYRAGAESVLRLEDNGCGLAASTSVERPAHFGIGLESIRQRLARLGGQATWSHRVEGGTIIELRFHVPFSSGVT